MCGLLILLNVIICELHLRNSLFFMTSMSVYDYAIT